jgi:phosphoribosylamine--glycine ligase
VTHRALLLGSGGRESALAWGLSRSPSVEELIVAPGNPGTDAFAESAAIDASSPDEVLALRRCG